MKLRLVDKRFEAGARTAGAQTANIVPGRSIIDFWRCQSATASRQRGWACCSHSCLSRSIEMEPLTDRAWKSRSHRDSAADVLSGWPRVLCQALPGETYR